MPGIKPINLGAEEYFRQNAAAHPEADAVVEGDRTVSYGELDRLATQVASQLCKYDTCIEEPIGILLPKGIASIVAQIAIIRIGGSCVPMDLAFPDQRIHKLYNNLQVRVVITNATERHRVPPSCNSIVVDDDLVADATHDTISQGLRLVQTGDQHRTHVLHTSGTTGEPKGVEILSQGILYLANNKVVVEMRKSDRVAQVAAPSFDVTLQEIWATLVVGGAIVIISKETLMDPYALHDTLRKQRVTGMIMTPTLMQRLVSAIPHIFATLDWVVTGGEPANPKVYQAIFDNGPPRILSNAYGPTECSCVTSYHWTQPSDCLKPTIPIGKAVSGVVLCILDDNQVEVKDGAIGELYIGGGTVSRGYHNRPEATAKRFCTITSASGHTQNFFRTGDLARYTEEGEIDFIGRNDQLVKIHSKRIDLTEIKTVILDSGFAIDTAVLPVSRPHKDTYIMAFVIPRESNAQSTHELEVYMKQYLPEYMLPRVELVPFLPMTPHGKTDSRLLVSTHIAACEEAEKQYTALNPSSETPLAWLKQLWISLLGVYKISNDSNFFECGGTSLQAAALLMHIRRRFNLKITMQQIYSASSLQQLADFVEIARADGTSTSRVDMTKLDTLIADSELVNSIEVPLGRISESPMTDRRHVFLTGATGFLGVHLLRDLIRRTDVEEVRCLMRTTDACTGRLLLHSLLKEVGVINSKQLRKVVALPGKLGSENLGLTASTFSDLAEWTDTIFHNGAHINWSQPYELHRGPNVIGTLDCIRLAVTTRVKSLHHVSSAGVTGPVRAFGSRDRIMEDVDMSDFQESLPYDLGYTQSKWVGDKMVLTMQKKGLPAVVYRPGFIMGDGVRSKIQHSDFMSRFFRGCLQLGYRPSLPGQTKAVVTPDFCSAAIVHIASNPVNYGHAFHVVPQSPEEDLHLDTAWTILGKIGYACSAVPYKEWIELMATNANVLQNPLFSLLPTLQEPVLNGRSLWELYNNMAVYDVTNCRAALADMKYEHKSGLDYDFLVNYMKIITEKNPIVPSKKATYGKY